MRYRSIAAIATGALLIAGGLAQAGEFTWTFDTDPTTGTNPLQIGGSTGDAPNVVEREIAGNLWRNTGGNPATGGFLAITYPVNSQRGYALFPDIDNGQSIVAFELEADIRSGNSVGDRAADGWSVSLARQGDPAITDPGNMGNFGNASSAAYEFGTQTGIAVSFDTWAGNTLPDGAADVEGIIVRVDGRTVHTVALATRHGACDDNTSLQTGLRDAAYWVAPAGDPYAPEAWSTLCWQRLRVVVTDTGFLSVYWKGRAILENFDAQFFPSPGRVILAGRTGGSNSNVHFDNLTLRTSTIAPDNEPPTTPTNFTTSHVGAASVGLTWGASTDNSGRVAYELERDSAAIGGTLATTSYLDTGVSMTTTYNYRLRATDIAGNKSDWVTLSATTVADQAIAGGVRGEIFDNLTGILVYENFVQSARWGTTADRYVYLSSLSFGEWTALGNTYGENYAFRVTGIITPPQTGAYRFFVRSDDGSEFHINTTGTTPPDPLQDFANAVESGCCGPFEEPGAGGNTQVGYEGTFPTSEPIQLTAGTQYGFLWMVKEGTGGDWGQVAWRMEGDTTAAGSLQPIPGRYLSGSRVDPIGTSISITGPEDQTAVDQQTVTLSAEVDYQSPFPSNPWYQWRKNGQPIIGASGATYQFTATAADNGAKYSVEVGAFGLAETSREMTLTVVADTFPPVPSAGAIVNRDGTTVDLGVGFDEPVTDATASVQANYTVAGGTVTGFTYYPSSKSALFKVTGLTPGASGTVTVRNVADTKGNAIPAAGVEATFKVSENMRWNIVGAPDQQDLGTVTPVPLAGNYVVPVDEDAFDIFSNGRGQWNNYDETVFVYEEITGDFDKKLRVEFQDNSSQWARAGLIMREDTNFGDNLDAQAGTQAYGNAGVAPYDGNATRYQKVHVNPVGPTLTGPGNNGNGSWEGNRRLITGGPSSSAGGGGAPLYPDAWCRIQREGNTFTIYRSDNGTTWTTLGTTTFDPPMAETVYVGPDYSPEVGNINNAADRGTFVAKMRDYGDTFATGAPTLGVAVDDGNITLDWTGGGALFSAPSIDGPWTEAGSGGSFSEPISTTGNKYFRIQ
jgi:hypothetical protein